MRRRILFLGAVLLVGAVGLGFFLHIRTSLRVFHHGSPPAFMAYRGPLTPVQRLIVAGARDQLTWGTGYDASYCVIGYPKGDVPRTKGACTDVVVRSLRSAGIDLQAEMHRDISANWSLYPRYNGNPKPDANIDQRRVPNQRVFLSRFGIALTKKTDKPQDWQPGDIVEWKMPFGHDHTGVLTDHVDRDGLPLVIHNKGNGPQEEDVLRDWTITGHFRYPKPTGMIRA